MCFDYLLKTNPKTNPQATALRFGEQKEVISSRGRGVLSERGAVGHDLGRVTRQRSSVIKRAEITGEQVWQ